MMNLSPAFAPKYGKQNTQYTDTQTPDQIEAVLTSLTLSQHRGVKAYELT